MDESKKEIVGAVAGVVASVIGWRMASRAATGLSFPGTAIAVTGLTLASMCDANDPSPHCRAGAVINLPGNIVGRTAVKLIDTGVGMAQSKRRALTTG
ncbi:MAG TPA: hypothetical protein EYF98_10820 [Planctomycetes bacterium]|nr:hypothetical protein [Planctomycetota bacterium]